jgi:16S rRNA (adenine1518-N6/adenine1519-N6)-dimethyltransferase
MTNLTSAPQIKQLLARHGLRPLKRLGQNFLIDRNVLDRIVTESGAGPETSVIEIGAGLGVVTQALAGTGARVVCVEADRGLGTLLEETLAGAEVEVVISDFLKLDLPAFLRERSEGKWIVVGNLPYYITTPIILKLIDTKGLISQVLIMMQREVAERLAGTPGSETYGSISVLVNYHFELRSVTRVSRNVFYPIPDVDSELVRLTPRAAPPVQVNDEDLLFRIVRAAFGKRRKTLLNALSSSAELGWDREQATRALEAADIAPARRGETLSLQEFAAISDNAAD